MSAGSGTAAFGWVNRSVSPVGVALLKRFEGFSGRPYQDSVGVWTIGYGHTEGVGPGTPHITEPQASALLTRDLNRKYAPAVNALRLPLNQNQFDALVPFGYNLGVGIFGPSHTIGQALRRKAWRAAADSMLLYDKAGGRVLEGLRRRRVAERALFLKPVVPPPKPTSHAENLDRSFRVIQGCPCNALLAPYVELLRRETGATINSIYRGQDAAAILHKHGKHTQAEIYASSPPGVANPPGRSTHERRSDAVAYQGPVGRYLPWWAQGVDVNDGDVARMIAAAKRHGWVLGQPYPSGREFHHVNFRKPPQAKDAATRIKIVALRAALPRS